MNKNKKSIHISAMVSLLFVLVGCSQQFESLKDTVSLALFTPDNIYISRDNVNALPYASIYAQIQGQGQVFMVLGYFASSVSALPASDLPEPPSTHIKLKWLSNNNQMLVTEYGRIIKTVNLNGGNLSASYSMQADPLALGLLKNTTPKIWRRNVDFQPNNRMGYTLNSHFESKGKTQIMINESLTTALHFIEYVTSFELNVHFENQFWIDPLSGVVLASLQTPAPGMSPIKITVLKPYSQEHT